MLRSCDIRGGGPGGKSGDVLEHGYAYMGAGVFVEGDNSVGHFYNVSFTDLRAELCTAIYAQGSTDAESPIDIIIAGCEFLRNSAGANIVTIGWSFVRAEISDTVFKGNIGNALLIYKNGNENDVQIVRCTFIENTGSGNGWPGYGSSVVINPNTEALVSISDCVFKGNIGDVSYTGGALTLVSGHVLMHNVSLIENTASGSLGGGGLNVQSGAKVTAINCFSLANKAPAGFGGDVLVQSAMLTLINSKCRRNCVFPSCVCQFCGGGLYMQLRISVFRLSFVVAGVCTHDLSHFCPRTHRHVRRVLFLRWKNL